MPWENESPMEQKQRFVSLLTSDRFTLVELCESFGISRKTGSGSGNHLSVIQNFELRFIEFYRSKLLQRSA
jgi:hypothetical protein